MKRFLLAIALFVGVGINSVYAVQIPMHIIDPSESGSRPSLAPPRPWDITQDDDILTMPAVEDEVTL